MEIKACTSNQIPVPTPFREEEVRSTYANSTNVQLQWGNPSGDFTSITIQQCINNTVDIMPIDLCSSGAGDGVCRCFDVTGSSTFWINPSEGVWMTFSAWNNDRHLMNFAYKIDIPEITEENSKQSTLIENSKVCLCLLFI